ncbi:hypothetical protein ACU632_17370, partial [Klebsiella aerogenes]
MSQYNTGNPPPSSDMRDAWDNNATIDDFVNGPQLTVTTRTGVEWDSLSGIQKKAEDQREQIAIDSEAVVDETRRNLIPLSRQYMTLAEAQADIANIPEGSVTYYRSPDDTALAIEVINNSGALAATGRKMPSQQQVNKAANSAQLAGVTVEDPLYDEEGVEIVHALADADGKAPLTTNRLGAVGLARAEVAALGGNAVPWAITDSRRIPYISGTPMGGVQIGNVEIVEIPGPPGIVFCDSNYIPMACTPGFDSDQDIPVIGGSGTPPETPVIPIYLRDWNGVRSQGQSLSIGEMPPASAAANPPL